MNLQVNGKSKVPPGFRFHPTEEELLTYYLKKKVEFQKIDLDVIRDIDLNKLEPWDIQEKCKIGSGPQNDWYFFSHKDKKYPTGTRTNRATEAGFWKATGRDKIIYSNFKRIGMRKTLVFYKGRAPHGEKSEWIMHEYRLQDSNSANTIVHDLSSVSRQDNCKPSLSEDGWVICRVFRKRNYQKTLDNNTPICLPTNNNSSDEQQQTNHLLHFNTKQVLNHFFSFMGKKTPYHDEINNHDQVPTSVTSTNNNQDHYIKLPMLTTSSSSPFDPIYSLCYDDHDDHDDHNNDYDDGKAKLSDWMSLDRLIASQLDGEDQGLCFNNEL